MPCQDRGHIGNANPPPRNRGDTDDSPGNSGHTDPSPQVDPNVESTLDSTSRDPSLPGTADTERNVSDNERHVAFRRSARCTNGVPPLRYGYQ